MLLIFTIKTYNKQTKKIYNQSSSREGFIFLQNNVNTETLCSFTRHFSLIFSYNFLLELRGGRVNRELRGGRWWEHNIHKRKICESETRTRYEDSVFFFYYLHCVVVVVFPFTEQHQCGWWGVGWCVCGSSMSCVFFSNMVWWLENL